MKKSNGIVDTVLAERAKTHGPFDRHAAIAQALKWTMRNSDEATEAWHALDADMREALEMIQHKIARILNGDPRHIDHWDDVCGYSRLVADRLRKEALDAKA